MKTFIVSALLMLSQLVGAAEFKKYVQVAKDHAWYVEYVQPRPGYPTVILVNGLTWTTQEWSSMSSALAARGLGVLKFDMTGMGQTLYKYGPIRLPIPYDQQARDIRVLLQQLKIAPPYNFVGLSYGGGISFAFAEMFPREVQHLVMVAPYTRPIESQDLWIRQQIAATRVMYPYNPATDEELYAFFLRQLVYTTYPVAEPVLLTHPYKLEATFQLVQGIRKFKPEDKAPEIQFGIHLVAGDLDLTVSLQMIEDFWRKVPQRSRLSRLLMVNAQHKIPEQYPEFLAAWVTQILKKNPLLFQGRDYMGYGSKKQAASGPILIDLSHD